MPRTVLIVGAGRIAGLNEGDPLRESPCTHAGAYRSLPEFDLAGVVDLDAGRARSFAEQFRLPVATDDLSRALAQVRPEIVSICVPYPRHCDVVLSVLASAHRPRVIFCEKPIADSLARAERMVRACDSAGVGLFVNNRRLTPFYQRLRQLVAEDLEGEIIALSAWCSSGLHAVGIHMLDLLQFLAGSPAWVAAEAETAEVARLPYSANFVPGDPRVRALIGFERDVVATFVNTAQTDFTYFEIEVLGRRGKIRASDNGHLLQVWRPAAPGASTLSYRLAEPANIVPDQTPLFACIARALAEIDGPDPSHPLSGHHGLASYRLLSALVDSANAQTRIRLRPNP